MKNIKKLTMHPLNDNDIFTGKNINDEDIYMWHAIELVKGLELNCIGSTGTYVNNILYQERYIDIIVELIDLHVEFDVLNSEDATPYLWEDDDNMFEHDVSRIIIK